MSLKLYDNRTGQYIQLIGFGIDTHRREMKIVTALYVPEKIGEMCVVGL